MSPDKQKLFDILYTKSFLYRENPPFKLASGKESFYYFDCKATTLDSEGAYLTVKVIFEIISGMINEKKIDCIGGLTLGADPISISTSIAAFQNEIRIAPIIVRKEAKEHGTEKWIEGSLKSVNNVIVIDDVITTGGSTVTAITRMRESGLNIVQAAVLIDREEGGRECIENEGVDVISLFKRSDFDRRRLKVK